MNFKEVLGFDLEQLLYEKAGKLIPKFDSIDLFSEGKVEVDELTLFITNSHSLYRRQIVPIIDNLNRKIEKGVYDETKALKLWSYLADNGAKEYAKEFGVASEWNKMFSVQDRKNTAVKLADFFADHLNNHED